MARPGIRLPRPPSSAMFRIAVKGFSPRILVGSRSLKITLKERNRYLLIVRKPAIIMKVRCATALCPRGSAVYRVVRRRGSGIMFHRMRLLLAGIVLPLLCLSAEPVKRTSSHGEQREEVVTVVAEPKFYVSG